MHLVKPTAKNIVLFLFALTACSITYSQENSPFSRYGAGDLYPQQSIASRGMGGLTAAYVNTQNINTVNPASYGDISLVTYDIGISVDARSLLSANPVSKYKSTNLLPSYLQLGVPLNKKGVGLVFGLRPYTRINYSVESNGLIAYDSLKITDSLHTLYEGNGGLNQVYAGLGKSWKNKEKQDVFNIGVNFGYEWGSKNISTKIDFPADSSYENWFRSNSTDTSRFWGVFVNPGFMASFTLSDHINPVTKAKSSYRLTVGGSGMFEQKLTTTRTITRETFSYLQDGGLAPIDSVEKVAGIKGYTNIPLTYTAGFTLNKYIANVVKKWSIGADYSSTKWMDYRYYGQPDQLNNSWFLHTGVEFSPDPFSNKSIFSSGTYRLGYYTGKDFQNADGNDYKVQAFTLGYSFNLRRYHSYDKQFTQINTAVEFGKRGNNANNITENFFKFSLGLSLSDIWFIKRKYD